jgi:hypothetical protein
MSFETYTVRQPIGYQVGKFDLLSLAAQTPGYSVDYLSLQGPSRQLPTVFSLLFSRCPDLF